VSRPLSRINFESLLDGLEKHILKEAAKGVKKHVATDAAKIFGTKDRELLSTVIFEACMVYDGTQQWADEVSRITFHALGEPITQVIKLLKLDANYYSALVALGAPANTALSPDQTAVSRAVERYETLLRDLDDIARAVPPPPAKRPRGKPSKTKDLRVLVECLAKFWESATGQPFTQAWHKESSGQRKPTTNSAAFVEDVVKFVDLKRLGELPKVTERIVAERRAATSCK
jgi:hypothetical protein